MVNPKQIFIASALTHLPVEIFDQYKRLIISIANLVEDIFDCKVKYAFEDSDPQLAKLETEKRPSECYRLDRELVEQSDLIIAEASFPSTGLGQELQIAEYNKKPIILILSNYQINIAKKKDYQTKDGTNHSLELGNKIVSVMVQGNPAIINELTYSNTEDCIDKLKSFLLDYFSMI